MKKILFVLLLFPFLFSNCNNIPEEEEPYSADYIMALAKKQAKKEKKNVMIMWHASWCGYCHLMDSLMHREEVAEFFEGNYVIEHMVVKERKDLIHLENPGADSLLASYHGDKAGIPFWVILDKKGNLLGDSYMREDGVGMDEPGQNTGCPLQDNEVAHLQKILKETSDIDQEGLDMVKSVFLKK